VKIVLKVLSTIMAVGAGAIVLVGYFVNVPLLVEMRQLLLQWAMLLGAGALFLGLFNLVSVHWTKLGMQESGWLYSAALILFFLLTLVLGLFFGPDSDVLLMIFNYVQVPVEASLMALLAVMLVVAGVRLVARQRDTASFVFVAVALLVLLGTAPWLVMGDSFIAQWLANVRAWLTQVWAVAGARGILLGVALGVIATGLRVLLASDRPYAE
jgi:hypothetical protein